MQHCPPLCAPPVTPNPSLLWGYVGGDEATISTFTSDASPRHSARSLLRTSQTGTASFGGSSSSRSRNFRTQSTNAATTAGGRFFREDRLRARLRGVTREQQVIIWNFNENQPGSPCRDDVAENSGLPRRRRSVPFPEWSRSSRRRTCSRGTRRSESSPWTCRRCSGGGRRTKNSRMDPEPVSRPCGHRALTQCWLRVGGVALGERRLA